MKDEQVEEELRHIQVMLALLIGVTGVSLGLNMAFLVAWVIVGTPAEHIRIRDGSGLSRNNESKL